MVALKDEVEAGEQDSTTDEEKSRQDKTGTPEEKVGRAADEKREEKLPPTPKNLAPPRVKPTFMKPSTPTLIINPPQIETPTLKLVRTVKEVIKPFPTLSNLKTVHLKAEPLKIVKPTPPTIESRPRQPQCDTKKLLPEVPKIKIVRPILTQVSAVEGKAVEEKRIQIKIPKIEHLRLIPAIPRVSQITTQDIVGAGKVSFGERTKVQKPAASIPEEDIAFLEQDPSQIPIIPDIILDPSSEGGPLGSVAPEGPVYVVVTEELCEIVPTLCGLIYRIKGKAGLPSTWVERKPDSEFLKRTLIERDLLIMSPKEIVDAFQKAPDFGKVPDEFCERIEGIYREGGFRFIVLQTPSELLNKVVGLLKQRLARYVPKLFIYKPKKMDKEMWELLIRACWGFVRSDRIIFEAGEYYLECSNVFLKQIQSVVNEVRKKLDPQKWPKDSPTGEDWLHKNLKYIVINHLVYNEGIESDSIGTEYGEPPIDVYVKGKDIAVEIETLYGRGEPVDRINDLLRHYKEKRGFSQLWLVFPNQQALLFCGAILKLTKNYRMEGLNVEPYLLDITGEGHQMLNGKKTAPGLMKLGSVIKLLRNRGLKREVEWLNDYY
jgi:hypothetical protein